MKENVKAILGVVDFVLPFEVIAAVGLVFAAENIVDAYISSGTIPIIWVEIYIIVVVLTAVGRYLTADEEEIDGLEDDIEEIKT